MPSIISRSAVGSAAAMLFGATLIIVVDVRMPSLDVVPDAIGVFMVLVGVLRLNGAVRGAHVLRTALVVLSLIAYR